MAARVLFLEPDALLASTYRRALERAGHSVSHHTSAAMAMQAADRQRPDILVIELQLARHNGVDFLYEFRSYREWQSIPVILMSQVPPQEAVMSGEVWEQLGITTYLYKPHTTLQQLVQSVDGALAATPA